MQKTEYEIRISDWSSNVCSSDLKPRAAKRLYFDVIPRAVDDYLSHLQAYDGEDERRLENPVWHIHNGEPPVPGTRLSFGMLLNLASVCNTEDQIGRAHV